MKKIFMIIINIVLSIIIILLVISIVREKQDDKRYGKKEYEIVIKDKYEIVAPRLFSSRTEFRITYKTRCLNRSEEDFDWKEWDNAVSRKTYIEYNIGDTITKQGMNLNEL